MSNIAYLIAFGSAGIGIIYGLILIWLVLKKNAGNEKMQEIAKAIQEGAKAYLNRQYKNNFLNFSLFSLFDAIWQSNRYNSKIFFTEDINSGLIFIEEH